MTHDNRPLLQNRHSLAGTALVSMFVFVAVFMVLFYVLVVVIVV